MAVADLRNAIGRAYPQAGSSNSIQSAAVLDIAFDYLLFQMRREGVFELCGMCFKGGTALRKFRIGHLGRFSYDLDFNIAPGSAGDAVDLIADAASKIPTDDFSFTITERRGHHGLEIETALVDGSLEAKMDFSERPIILPMQELLPVETPLRRAYPFEFDQRIPLMHLEENIAEKLSRWQTLPLVRDLYDLAHVGNDVKDVHRLAELYVLKSHINWSQSPPNRRNTQSAKALGEFTRSLEETVFVGGDLVAPTIRNDREKSTAIRQDLTLVSLLAQRCDEAITPELWEIAQDNGQLQWNVEQRAQQLHEHQADMLDDDAMSRSLALSRAALSRTTADTGSHDSAICGFEMPRAQKPCVLPQGHGGSHRSVR